MNKIKLFFEKRKLKKLINKNKTLDDFVICLGSSTESYRAKIIAQFISMGNKEHGEEELFFDYFQEKFIKLFKEECLLMKWDPEKFLNENRLKIISLIKEYN